MKEKRKKLDYFDFLSPLGLAACQARLIEAELLKVQFTMISAEEMHFIVEYSDYGLVLVRGHCTLKTWAQSLSRLECQLEVEQRSPIWIFGIMLGLAAVLMGMPFILFSSVGSLAWGWASISFLAVAFILALLMWTQYHTPIEDSPERFVKLLRKTLDAEE